jgi:hypothetical protein
MAEIPLKQFNLTDVNLTFAQLDADGDPVAGVLDDLKQHTAACTFVPTAATSTYKTLSPSGVFSNVSAPTWVLNLEYAQDWETEDGLCRLLFDNDGEDYRVTFRPRTGRGPSFEADVTLVPGQIGGTVDQAATASVSLGVKGRPRLVPAV